MKISRNISVTVRKCYIPVNMKVKVQMFHVEKKS